MSISAHRNLLPIDDDHRNLPNQSDVFVHCSRCSYKPTHTFVRSKPCFQLVLGPAASPNAYLLVRVSWVDHNKVRGLSPDLIRMEPSGIEISRDSQSSQYSPPLDDVAREGRVRKPRISHSWNTVLASKGWTTASLNVVTIHPDSFCEKLASLILITSDQDHLSGTYHPTTQTSTQENNNTSARQINRQNSTSCVPALLSEITSLDVWGELLCPHVSRYSFARRTRIDSPHCPTP